jgi:glycosyltransferase involved in cell wall biosynthesis
MESIFSYEDPRQYVYTAAFLIKAFWRLLALKLEGIDFDVVSVHFATESFLMRFLRKAFGWPYVFVLEGYTELEAKQAKAANASVAISDEIVRRCEIHQGFRPWKVSVGVDRARFSPAEKSLAEGNSPIKNDKRIVLCVCRLEPRKDIPTLLFAMKEVLKTVDARLVIVGNGLLRERLLKMVENMGLSNSVTIDSKTEYDNLPAYYRSADVFSMSTLYEGLGIVFLEAMSSGLPIVSTSVGAIPEILDSSGILVPPRDPKALALAITSVLTDQSLRNELIAKGERTVSRFDWKKLISDYEQIYQRVASGSHYPRKERRPGGQEHRVSTLTVPTN